MDGANKEITAQLKQIGIEGMIGNKLFLNHRLWIDMENKKFALTPVRISPRCSEIAENI